MADRRRWYSFSCDDVPIHTFFALAFSRYIVTGHPPSAVVVVLFFIVIPPSRDVCLYNPLCAALLLLRLLAWVGARVEGRPPRCLCEWGCSVRSPPVVLYV